jgi:hypothetical protein
MTGCATADLGLATGNVLNTLNVQCAIPHVGQHVSVTFDDANVTVTIPLTYTVTDSAGFADHYAGTATDLGVLIPSPPTSSVTVFESYVATSSTDGASCEITFAGTLS